MTNVITVYQPYASLVMTGIKTWETRGLPPHGDMRPEGVRGLPGRRVNAGDRIAIHSGATWAPGWLRWHDRGSPKCETLACLGADMTEDETGYHAYRCDPDSLPTSAILGTVAVVGAIPVVYYDDGPPAGWDESRPIIDTATDGGIRRLTLWPHGDLEGYEEDITDQLPYGHWLPGRWAWELADPIPTTEQCPACDGTGWILDCDACRESGKSLADTDCSASGCRVCKRTGSCPPIPAKGKQGVWQWTT